MNPTALSSTVPRLAVAFTGAGGAASEALHRLLLDRYELFFADADISAIPDCIPADRKLSIPRADAPDFVDGTAAVLAARGINVLVPGVDEELLKMPEIAARLPGLTILAPPSDFVLAMQDKLETVVRLRAAGLDAPMTTTAQEPGGVPYPCIAKPRSGRGSRGVMRLDGPDQVAHYLGLYRLPPSAVVLQEQLVGTEYTVFVSADAEGHLRTVIPIRILVKRGITIQAVIDEQPRVIDYCRALHAAFRPSGPYNVQLVLTQEGRVAPFEINPRVSTTLCLAVAAGADPIADWWGRGAPLRHVPAMRLKRNWRNNLIDAGGA